MLTTEHRGSGLLPSTISPERPAARPRVRRPRAVSVAAPAAQPWARALAAVRAAGFARLFCLALAGYVFVVAVLNLARYGLER
jgi:hypothetical protein